ncbi:MAG: FAD-dependent oxidoreductase [Candidatus Lindowbacteria bacterium]|nr:FAD-dependent oxidoreductase [Candidatus Lindowbacteria bacterium]
MPELAHLFSPITIGKVTIRNRIFASAHILNYAENGLPSERHARYYEARAKGGIGLIIQEGTVVSPHSEFHAVLSHGFKDEIIPALKRISEAVHSHGAKLLLQLAHGGVVASSYFVGGHMEGCSPVPTPAVGELPRVMDDEAINKSVQDHVDTALRAKEAGYDGVELHFGHGYLQQQFLSPYYNIRKDAFGGSLENRMRFGMRVIDAVRKAVGDGFIVGVRTSAEELIPEGYTMDFAKQFIPLWVKTGKIDFLNVSVANSTTMAFAIPPMMIPQRPFVFCAAEIKQIVDIPVFTAIRINDPVIGNDIIKNNEADMVAMTRATVCDPELPNKAKEGRLDDIRLCIACNEGCWERWARNAPITCMQNPETGNEGVLKIVPAPKKKKVMVIGGGCAGMEAAIVAKQRGHDVVLYEKSGELGGAILIAAKAPSRQELGQAVRFLKHEVERLGVEVRLSQEATSAVVLKEKPDAVIVATGATTITDPKPDVVGPGSAIDIQPGAHVVTAEDVLEGKAQTGQRVAIADQQNYMKGLVTAEFLADKGKDVTLIMPLPLRYLSANPYDMDASTHAIQILNLKTKNVKRISDCKVKKVSPGKVVIEDVFTQTRQELDADTLVLSYWRKSEIRLHEELRGKVKELYLTGDALSPRRLIEAIHESYKIAMNV